MARPDHRIERGQKISSALSASGWNRTQDAADIVLGVRTDAEAGPFAGGISAANYIVVQNNTAEPVPLWGVLALGAPGTVPTDEVWSQFFTDMVLGGTMPQGGTEAVGIAMEPIAVGQYGRMAISGRFSCKVKVLSDTHRYARGRLDDVTQLISAECGPIYMPWSEGVGNDQFAVGIA